MAYIYGRAENLYKNITNEATEFVTWKDKAKPIYSEHLQEIRTKFDFGKLLF